ncbi:hypothetical protein [Nocardia nepalensis]|uniref:hypothetical protein n=1 Tax=Nocardia nepalensis TaxID=3375448 RepID=UPI003B678533
MAGLTMIYQRDTLVPVLPGKIPALDESELSRYRPSYRYLSYLTARSGGNPHADLPGSDRPELVDDIITAETYWLRQQH